MSTFSEELFCRIDGIYRHILAHPFLQGLADGTLSEAAFRFYAIQDALYLRDYARGLSLLSAKSPTDEAAIMFSEHAKNAIVVERALHGSFFAHWQLSPQAVYATPMAPNNVPYTSYLLRVAYERPFHEGLGAFLACYWIYWEVGKELEHRGSPVALYQRWIDTYAGDAFASVVKQVLALTNQVAETLTAEEKARTAEHFVITARCEYMFWDMGYREQTWEV
jgi:thiaminase (transcriptional activator TenA)